VLLAGGRALAFLGAGIPRCQPALAAKPKKILETSQYPTSWIRTLLARQDDIPMLDIMLHHHFNQVLDGTPLIPRIQHLDNPFFGWHCLHEQLELVIGCLIL
jgi:hypothetical protein